MSRASAHRGRPWQSLGRDRAGSEGGHRAPPPEDAPRSQAGRCQGPAPRPRPRLAAAPLQRAELRSLAAARRRGEQAPRRLPCTGLGGAFFFFFLFRNFHSPRAGNPEQPGAAGPRCSSSSSRSRPRAAAAAAAEAAAGGAEPPPPLLRKKPAQLQPRPNARAPNPRAATSAPRTPRSIPPTFTLLRRLGPAWRQWVSAGAAHPCVGSARPSRDRRPGEGAPEQGPESDIALGALPRLAHPDSLSLALVSPRSPRAAPTGARGDLGRESRGLAPGRLGLRDAGGVVAFFGWAGRVLSLPFFLPKRTLPALGTRAPEFGGFQPCAGLLGFLVPVWPRLRRTSNLGVFERGLDCPYCRLMR